MHIFAMLADEQTSDEQFAIFRRMSPEERWQAAQQLYWTCRRHKAAYLQGLHPEWSEKQVEERIRQIFQNART